jgi:hypothetical protein
LVTGNGDPDRSGGCSSARNVHRVVPTVAGTPVKEELLRAMATIKALDEGM